METTNNDFWLWILGLAVILLIYLIDRARRNMNSIDSMEEELELLYKEMDLVEGAVACRKLEADIETIEFDKLNESSDEDILEHN